MVPFQMTVDEFDHLPIFVRKGVEKLRNNDWREEHGSAEDADLATDNVAFEMFVHAVVQQMARDNKPASSNAEKKRWVWECTQHILENLRDYVIAVIKASDDFLLELQPETTQVAEMEDNEPQKKRPIDASVEDRESKVAKLNPGEEAARGMHEEEPGITDAQNEISRPAAAAVGSVLKKKKKKKLLRTLLRTLEPRSYGLSPKVDMNPTDRRVQKVRKMARELFERKKNAVLDDVPKYFKSLFRQVGFSKWYKTMFPVLVLSPYDVPPGRIRNTWMKMYEKVKAGNRLNHMSLLVYWYGSDNLNRAYSLVPAKSFITYDEGEGVRKGMDRVRDSIEKKERSAKRLSLNEQMLVRGWKEMAEDLEKNPEERLRRIVDFPEVYDMINLSDLEELDHPHDLFDSSSDEEALKSSDRSCDLFDSSSDENAVKRSDRSRVLFDSSSDEKAVKRSDRSRVLFDPSSDEEASKKSDRSRGLLDSSSDEKAVKRSYIKQESSDEEPLF